MKNNICYTEQLISIKIQSSNIYICMSHNNEGWILYILITIPENIAELNFKIAVSRKFAYRTFKSAAWQALCTINMAFQQLCQLQNSGRQQTCYSF